MPKPAKAARALQERLDQGLAPEPPALEPRKALSLGGLIDAYEGFRRGKGEPAEFPGSGLRVVRKALAGYLDQPAASFSKRDLRDVRDTIHARYPVQSNRTIAYLAPILKWGVGEDLLEPTWPAMWFASAKR